MPLTLQEQDGNTIHVAWVGDITQMFNTTSDPFTDLLGPNCYKKQVILDLQRAGFVESSGIGWLVGCHTRFTKAGGKLILHSLPPILDDLLVKLMRLDKLLTIRSTRMAAQDVVSEEGGK